MKNLFIAAILAATPAALAHELDSEQASVPAQQMEKAKDLPATVVVRVSKTDPTKIEVAHLNKPVRAGKKISKLSFEKMAMNAEKTGVAYNSSNELDVTSSTSSWVFAVGRPSWGYTGYRPYYGNYYPSNAYYPQSYYYNSYYSPYYRPYYTPYYNSAYYPTYSYYGYNYGYAPYYSYSDASYNYAYCGWMY